MKWEKLSAADMQTRVQLRLYISFWTGRKPESVVTEPAPNPTGILTLISEHDNVLKHWVCVLWQHTMCCWFQKAEAELAYELQRAKEQQKIRLEETEIEVVQRKKQITIEEKEIDRASKELIATVKRPADAEAYKIQQLAEGQKWVTTDPFCEVCPPIGREECRSWWHKCRAACCVVERQVKLRSLGGSGY